MLWVGMPVQSDTHYCIQPSEPATPPLPWNTLHCGSEGCDLRLNNCTDRYQTRGSWTRTVIASTGFRYGTSFTILLLPHPASVLTQADFVVGEIAGLFLSAFRSSHRWISWLIISMAFIQHGRIRIRQAKSDFWRRWRKRNSAPSSPPSSATRLLTTKFCYRCFYPFAAMRTGARWRPVKGDAFAVGLRSNSISTCAP